MNRYIAILLNIGLLSIKSTTFIKKINMKYRLLFVFLLLLSCQVFSQNQDPVPAHDDFKIESKEVGETRTINVWKPSGYDKSSAKFPVLYMADGGIQEDFPHVANTLAKLIKSKKIPPVILVGIENTQRRRDLTGPTEDEEDKKIAPVVGGSEKFRAFINNELFTEINKRYRTGNEKGIIGESLAGLFVMETFLHHSDMFDFYIAIDPSLWWNKEYEVKTAKESLAGIGKKPKKLWFTSSGEKGISEAVNGLSQVLKATEMKNVKWKYEKAPGETHATIFRASKEKALIWTFTTK